MISLISKLFMLILLLLITGCSSPVPVDMNTPPPPAPTSVLTKEAQAAPTQSQIVPAQAGPDLIKIGFEDSIRLIPATLDPEKQSTEITTLYQTIMESRSENWAGGAVSKENSLMLSVDTLSQDKTITLKYPVHVSITQKDAPMENLNMVAPMGGGGGGDIKEFSPFPLQAGEFDLMPEDPSPVNLSLPDSPSFSYMFKMTCQQAGLFELTFTMPYSVTETSGSQDRAAIYTALFACPQSVTVWGIGGPELQKINQLVFQNGEYVQQP